MLLPILTLPEPALRERSKELDPKEITTPEFQEWLDDLVETMHKADGVGIAAPQTGRQVRVFVAMDGSTPHIVINPVIVKKSWRLVNDEEGCLSVPGKYGFVKRYRSITMKALNRRGEKMTLAVSGYFARVLQHELDHLDGILYIDRASKIFNVNI